MILLMDILQDLRSFFSKEFQVLLQVYNAFDIFIHFKSIVLCKPIKALLLLNTLTQTWVSKCLESNGESLL